MSTRTLLLLPRSRARARTRIHISKFLGAGAGVVLGFSLAHPLRHRLDARDAPPSPRPSSRKEQLDPELLRQLSGGSVAGFLSGLVIAVFSRTLVLLLGLSVVIIQVATKYGIDLIQQLKLKQRLRNSRILAALEDDAAFKLSFGLFFAMSAFMQFDRPT
ncbi:hypothetical protein AAE478_003902 [Parahypoxylon ruwenzoriense]